mmetsp:Transcript_27925/g.66325  ORF Transcript_27925/g.66325 Transcript_27925/m.66325 type:complete len:213 (+) Transcript_27925:197-835(+)
MELGHAPSDQAAMARLCGSASALGWETDCARCACPMGLGMAPALWRGSLGHTAGGCAGSRGCCPGCGRGSDGRNCSGKRDRALALGMIRRRRSASSMSARQVGLKPRVAASPSTHRASCARVIATLSRRISPTKPMPDRLGLARTQESMTTSSCRPWKLSTVSMKTSPAFASPHTDLKVFFRQLRCSRYGVMTPTLTGSDHSSSLRVFWSAT